MKSLLLTLEYPPFKGGVANYYGHLVKHWPNREGIEVVYHQKHWLFSFFKLNSFLKNNPGGNVLIGQILPLGTVAYLRYLIKPYKYSVFLHGMDFTFALKKSRKKYLSSLILNKTSKIICANSYVANLAINFQANLKDKIIIVNPGINEASLNHLESDAVLLKEKYQTKDKIVLLSLGRLVKRKGVDMVIEALSSLDKDTRDKICYIVAGNGNDADYLKNLARQKDVVVNFTGEISESEKWSLLDLCDIFIMPAREINGDFEGFGIVYLEANICGKPVIAGNSGGVPDAVVNNQTGLLVNPESAPDITQAILSLVNNPLKRNELGNNGHNRAVTEFLWPKQIKKIADNL
jgi:phosphatidylinositol alpha-1,6-mannosyltransferase